MAAFNAGVRLDLLTGPAERQLQKIERGSEKVEAASRDILAVEKKIVAEKSRLITLEGKAAQAAQNNIRGLHQQISELVLQKRELSQIVALEKRRAASDRNLSSVPAAQSAESAQGCGGGGAAELAGIGGFAATSAPLLH